MSESSWITKILFVVYIIDCFVPDPLPYIDEIVLFLFLMGRGSDVMKAVTLFLGIGEFFLKIP